MVAASVAMGLGLACTSEVEPTHIFEPQPEPVVDPLSAHVEAARTRLAALEEAKRDATDFAVLPASDGRLGPDPYRLIALPDGRFAGLLRGADRLVAIDADGRLLASAPAPHDPTDLALRAGELLVVGTGEGRIARYDADTFEPAGELELPGAIAPRAIVASADRVFVSDEHHAALHELHEQRGELQHRAVHDYCHGPIQLRAVEELVLGVCLLEHRVRVDRLAGDGLETLATIEHDGPIWSLEVGAPTRAGARLLALTGVEDHPLERVDGGFQYIDSYVFVYELSRDRDAPGSGVSLERRATTNVSMLGVVTPKWSRWLPAPTPTLVLAGYATEPLLTLTWTEEHGFGAAPQPETRPGSPGTRDAVVLGDGRILAADALFDRWLRFNPRSVTAVDIPDPTDRPANFEERLGEALMFTTAMAPWNLSDRGQSQFTCETCHFEGRTDGRVHFTGRVRSGERVHAVSKPLLGLFPNRPHFTRALDRTTTEMIDNEFGVANRFSGHGSWFELGVDTLPWLADLRDWPAEDDVVGPELLRRALFRFLIRFSMPSNPAARGRDGFAALEARGAALFARWCEDCHQARLSTDAPHTRVRPGPDGDLGAWEALIFSGSGPLIWASDEYVQTQILPWVHDEGARVASLRRLYLKWPYFTNGRAKSLEDVLEGVRLPAGRAAGRADHDLGPADAGELGLSADEREALLAFLRLL